MVDRSRKKFLKMVTSLDILYSDLGSVSNEINILIDAYGEDAYINFYQEPYSDRDHLGVFATVDETDEEMNTRIRREEEHERQTEEAERREFERLSKKFNN